MAGIPEFKDLESMQKFLAKAKAGKTKDSPTGEAKPKPKRKPRHKPAEKDVSGELIEEAPKVPIYKSIHFYLRTGDSWEQLLKDGREETQYQGPGTLVFCHEHFHGEPCIDSCRMMK